MESGDPAGRLLVGTHWLTMSARDVRSLSLQFGFSYIKIESLTAVLNCGARATLARYWAPRFHCRVLPQVLTGALAEPTSRLASRFR
jgi:hypothetical protein